MDCCTCWQMQGLTVGTSTLWQGYTNEQHYKWNFMIRLNIIKVQRGLRQGSMSSTLFTLVLEDALKWISWRNKVSTFLKKNYITRCADDTVVFESTKEESTIINIQCFWVDKPSSYGTEGDAKELDDLIIIQNS